MKQGRIWDEEQVTRLQSLIASGASVLRAAAALRRSQTSVQIQARKLGTPFPTMLEARRRRAAKEAEALNGSRAWTA
jgi:hypothetical protein